jgi:hypothetical protein
MSLTVQEGTAVGSVQQIVNKIRNILQMQKQMLWLLQLSSRENIFLSVIWKKFGETFFGLLIQTTFLQIFFNKHLIFSENVCR